MVQATPIDTSSNSVEDEDDYYQNALKKRIQEVASPSACDIEETTGCEVNGAIFRHNNIRFKYALQSFQITLPNLWYIQCDEQYSSELDDLKAKQHKTETELQVSRKCNESLVQKQSKLSMMAKELKMNAHRLNASALKEGDQYELAAISGHRTHDQRFITECIWILHDRNFDTIKRLSKSGRNSKQVDTKKIDPKILLTIKNIFSSRIRKNSKDVDEANERLRSFDKLLNAGIKTAKQVATRK